MARIDVLYMSDDFAEGSQKQNRGIVFAYAKQNFLPPTSDT